MSSRSAPILLMIFAIGALALALAAGTARASDGDRGAAVEVPAPNDPGLFSADRWRVHFQTTYLYQQKPHFDAEYTGPNSLLTASEGGHTWTATLFLGFRPWRNGEIFFNPEMIQSEEISGLHGLGGLSNSENQKGGGANAKFYSARAFLRQTIPLGSEPLAVEGGPNQFAGTITSRRLVLTVGQMSVIDVFDNNSFAHDGRTQFMNWALMAYGASDFAADARGYTWGIAVEYYRDDWAFRFGHFAQPIHSNGLAIDFKLYEHFGDDVEIEHDHMVWGLAGKVRLLGFLNYARMAAFDDAMAYAQRYGGVPDIANVRKTQAKLGFGISAEQDLTRDLGVFGRFSWNDGRTETYTFAEIDRSLTLGAALKGRLWLRPDDTVGLAFVQDGIADPRRDYLEAGGLATFIGDGRLNYSPERIIETYYSLRALAGLWLTAGLEYVTNPAYNADRGPVIFYSGRAHVEY